MTNTNGTTGPPGKSRGNWGSRFGFIMAAAGSAVGLGNIWKFPYITGMNGGGAFVLIYLGSILVVGLPIMISEFVIGQRTQRNPVGAFRELAGKKSLWQSVGWLGVASGFIILAFYSVVAGQAMAYIFKAISGFNGSAHEIETQFTSLKTNAGLSILWHTIFMGLTIFIVIGGVKDGIEKWSKLLMPMLAIILLGLTLYGLFFSSGGMKAVKFLFEPNFSKLSSEAVLAALGHAFFTLSLGMGAMITYGSYLDKKTNLPKAAVTIVLLDTIIALLAGIAIFSLVFQYGMKEGSGPGLIFQTLPVLFKETGQFISVPFFILLTFAALTSSISLLEVVVSYFIDEKGWSRIRSTLLLGGAIYLIGILAAIDKIKINFLGKQKSFFDIFDDVSYNYMLPIGGLFICLFVGWFMKRKIIQSENFNPGMPIYKAWNFILKFLTPIAVFLILLLGLKIL
jgi:NSS family neurotransmitter:Na+ symporter